MKASTSSYAIDANVILRFLLRDHPTQSPRAKITMDAVRDGRLAVVCDPIQLAEAVWVLRSTYEREPTEIAAGLTAILNLDSFLVPDKERYLHALSLYGSTIPHFGDACVCAMSLDECGGRLLSFDKKLSNVPGVERMEEA